MRCFTWLSGVDTFSAECRQRMEPKLGTPGCSVCITPEPGAGFATCQACPPVTGVPSGEQAKFRYRLTIGQPYRPFSDPTWLYESNMPFAYESGSWDLVFNDSMDCTWHSLERELVVYDSQGPPRNDLNQKRNAVYLLAVSEFPAACLQGSYPWDPPIAARPRFSLEFVWDSGQSKVIWVLKVMWRAAVPHPCNLLVGKPAVEYTMRFRAASNDCLTPPSTWQPSPPGSGADSLPAANIYMNAYYANGQVIDMLSPYYHSIYPGVDFKHQFVSNFYQFFTLAPV